MMVLLSLGAVAKPSYQQLADDGNKALSKKDYVAAVAKFERLVREYPKKAGAHNMLGFALYQQGRTVRALYEFRQALSRDRHHSEALHNLILAVGQHSTELARQRKYTEALQLTDEIISNYRWHPQLDAVHFYRGNVLFFRGDEASAMEEWKKASRHNPQSAIASFLEGYDHWSAGRLQPAGVAFQQALKKIPDQPVFRNFYGRLLEDLGKFDLALAQYQKILESDHPPYLDLWLNASRVHRRKKDWSQAVKALEEARGIRPDFASIHAMLASLLDQMGQSEEAAKELELAQARDPRPLVLFHGQGEMVFVDGKEVGPAPTAAFVDSGKRRLEVGLTRQEASIEEGGLYLTKAEDGRLSLETRSRATTGPAPAPPFVLKDRTNRRWRLSDYLYKSEVLLVFWTATDPEAANHLDRLVEYCDRYAPRLVGAAIHIDPKLGREALQLYLAKPHSVGHLWGEGSVLADYQGQSTPYAVVINREGFISDRGPTGEVLDRLFARYDKENL